MKKALLFLASLFFLTSASAQKLTEKKLLGYWAMTTFESSMGIVDFKASKATLSESEKKDMDKKDWASTEQIMLESLDYFRDIYIEFKPGNIVKFNIDGETEGQYSLYEKGGKQYLIEPGMAENSEEVMIEVKSGKLYLSVDDDEGGFITMSYELSKPKAQVKLGTSVKLKGSDLFGSWKVAEYSDSEGVISGTTGAYKLADGIKKDHTAQEIEEIEQGYIEMAEVVKGLEFVFSPRVVVLKHNDEEFDRGAYIVETDEKTYMQITYAPEEGEEEEESQDIYEIYSKDNALYLMAEDGSLFKCVRK